MYGSAKLGVLSFLLHLLPFSHFPVCIFIIFLLRFFKLYIDSVRFVNILIYNKAQCKLEVFLLNTL